MNTGTSNAHYKKNCRLMLKDMEQCMLDLDLVGDEFDLNNDLLLVNTVESNVNNNVSVVSCEVNTDSEFENITMCNDAVKECISESYSVSELAITVDDIPSESELEAFCDNYDYNGSDSDDDIHVKNIVENINTAYETEGDRELKFRSQLEDWASDDTCLSSNKLNKLLLLLRENGHPSLPADARTLMRIANAVEFENKCGGQLIYFGITKSLAIFLNKNKVDSRSFTLLFNIDGLPLFHSSNRQLWPILCIADYHGLRSAPFIVCLFCGNTKPNSLREYLSEFISELNALYCDGINVQNDTFSVSKTIFVLDAPARSWVKCIKPHNGYSSCERCEVKGIYEQGRVIMTELCAQLRSDEKFSDLQYLMSGHQVGDASPLLDCTMQLGLVSSFVLDYMHLVCLGVVRRIMYFLTKGPKNVRLGNTTIELISKDLIALKDSMPSEFQRRPRSLKEMERWKATEWRQFLLYTGPIVLKKHVSQQIYENFLCLSIGVSILLSKTDTISVKYARQLLTLFVKNSEVIYGRAFIVYNVHSVIHLPDDVINHNCTLDFMSAFPFENFLGILKKSVKSPNNPAVQIAKRTEEIYRRVEKNLLKTVQNTCRYSTNARDNFYQLRNGCLCVVCGMWNDKTLIAHILPKRYLERWFSAPCDSRKLNISAICKASFDKHCRKRARIHPDDIMSKMVHVTSEKYHIFVPLLHQ